MVNTNFNVNNPNYCSGIKETKNSGCNPETHTVKPGETLSSIARKYFGDSKLHVELFTANKSKTFSSPDALAVGQVIKLPQHLFNKEQVEQKPVLSKDNSKITPQKYGNSATVIEFHETIPDTHTVQSGETLSSIARKYYGDDASFLDIFEANKGPELSHPNATLFVDQKIKLPAISSDNSSQKSNPYDTMKTYTRENPLSYLTLTEKTSNIKREDASGKTKEEPVEPNLFEKLISNFFPDEEPEKKYDIKPLGEPRVEPKKQVPAKNISLSDAIKVNRTFDIQPDVNLKNLRNNLDKWALSAANVLEEFNTTIKTGTGDKSINIDSNYLKNLAGKFQNNKQQTYEGFKSMFQNDMNMAFINTLWAIDDIANDIKNDPFYSKNKDEKKVIDLAGASKDFQLGSDKLPYMGKLGAHKHRNIELSIAKKTDINSSDVNTTYKAENMIKELSKHFSPTGRLTDPVAFENDVYILLENTSARKNLIEYFKLDSKENKDNLIPGIVSEGGVAKSQLDYNSYFAIGSVILNRTLGKNIKNAAVASAKGKDLTKFSPVTVKKIIYEQGQFAVTWHNVPGKGVTLFDYQKSLNNLYKTGKLKEDGNSHTGFKLANEAVNDLYSGINKMSAEVNGKVEKGVGRSTADLFYFNQSRNDHYSESKTSAVKFTDINSTHVFFKAWDKQAYFTH